MTGVTEELEEHPGVSLITPRPIIQAETLNIISHSLRLHSRSCV